MPAETRITRIISGGQTGPDRAALDIAIAHGILHGGHVPRGRLAEDGALAARYRMEEATSPDPAVRTRWNVEEAGATLVLHAGIGRLGAGTELTISHARAIGRPLLVVDLQDEASSQQIRDWLLQLREPDLTLNVAGPRESEIPGLQALAASTLDAIVAGHGLGRIDASSPPAIDAIYLWLLPEAASARLYADLIDLLAKRWNLPIFPPHLTLAGPFQDATEAVSLLERLAQDSGAIEVRTRGLIARAGDFYRTFFIATEHDGPLAGLRRAAWPEDGSYEPHLSLAYGRADDRAAASLPSLAPSDLPASIRFDRMAAWKIAGSPEQWHAIHTARFGVA